MEHDQYRVEGSLNREWQKWQKGRMNKQGHQRFVEQEEGSIKEIILRRQKGRRAKQRQKKGKIGRKRRGITGNIMKEKLGEREMR